MRDGLQGRSYLEDLGCLGTALLVVLEGLRGLDMAGGLVSLVVAVNLNGDSPLLIEVFGLEVGGGGRRRAQQSYGIKQVDSSDVNP